MKKFFALVAVGLLVGYGAGFYHCQSYIDNAPVIETVELPSKWMTKGDVVPAPLTWQSPRAIMIDATPAAPAETSAPKQSAWSYILSNVVTILAAPIATIIAALVSILLTMLAKKFNIQIKQDQHDLITSYATTGVMRAEAWAASKKDKPSNSDKLNFAVGAIRDLMATDMGKTFTNDQLAHYAEHAVYKAFNQPDPNEPATETKPAT